MKEGVSDEALGGGRHSIFLFQESPYLNFRDIERGLNLTSELFWILHSWDGLEL